ncbi:MAG: hypothetical protein GTO55_11680 [Armatimonadetes bacterium]|nr:hypothetical protein [Armatimonadota bacterium]NIM24876.1 hypothetical protein [Armatimonadota bacterium]NIM68766.1 hypothetical protein [Armatimonadota bacterium]NIM77027.1 hypothetical protein [Armatimonadota bacterium]NIN06962.1 hypothetical protein [Armatimonadota bacterium]
MAFVDQDKGWVAVVGRKLLSTNDGGTSWATEVPEGIQIDFLDEKTGWAIRSGLDGTLIWRTTDGGDSWIHTMARGTRLRDIAVVSEDEAWGIKRGRAQPEPGQPSALVHTRDGGASWQEISHPYSDRLDVGLDGIFFLDKTHGWVICAGPLMKDPTRQGWESRPPMILRTEDGGKTFQIADTPWAHSGSFLPHRFSFSNANEGWLAMGGPLLHTTDGGKTWEVVTPKVNGTQNEFGLIDCSFPTPTYGWAVGYGGVALRTRDGGKTWEQVETGTEGIKGVRLDRVVFIDEEHGWILGEGGIPPSDMPPQHPGHGISFILKYRP